MKQTLLLNIQRAANTYVVVVEDYKYPSGLNQYSKVL